MITSVKKVCAWCGVNFRSRVYTWKKPTRTCSPSCRSRLMLARPEVKKKLMRQWNKQKKTLERRECALCGQEFLVKPQMPQRFCNRSCSAKWRNDLPKFKDINRKLGRRIGGWNAGKVALWASIRMSLDPPRWRPGVEEKIRKAGFNRIFIKRGGNGQLTVPQKKLAKALRLPMEVGVFVAGATGAGARTKYFVDIADTKSHTAIEVDGASHSSHVRKEMDLRKEMALSSAGWTVLRFKNKRVLFDLEAVVSDVRKHIQEKRRKM